jgi:hypothetical protein
MAALTGASAAKDQPGVYGTNDAGGDAVFGQATASGRGVVGVSQDHTAVEGNTVNGMGVFGSAAPGGAGRGVVGVGRSGTGIEGSSETGSGVWAVSGQGVGIHAKGGQLAGYFDGPVEITGNLTIQGVSIQAWLQRIIALEQEVTHLETHAAGHGGGHGGGGGGAAMPFLSVSAMPNMTENGYDVLIGSTGWSKDENIVIQFRSISPAVTNPWSFFAQAKADTNGAVSAGPLAAICPPGNRIELRATGPTTGESQVGGFSA